MPLITAAELGLADFRPRFPWWGGDLQTLRNSIKYAEPDFSAYPATRLTFGLTDGSGDRMLALYNGPAQTSQNPAIMLIHGLTGCETSRNIKSSAAFFLSQGFPVIRLNLRGAGPSAETCRQHYHAGRSDDLAMVIEQLSPDIRDRKLFLVGTSLGGNILLKFLADCGLHPAILAAAAVSPPVDLRAAQQQIMAPRNGLYHWHLLRHMKAGLVAKPADIDLSQIRTVYDFDDRIVAPANGFADADDYYARCSSAPLLGRVQIPTLAIHPHDDPWIPAESIARAAAGAAAIRLLLPRSGGHIGFHGADRLWPWHNRAILAFFHRVLGPRVANMQHQPE